ncbi:MAG TPA: O-acetylhomoserine aminocarboxypropyltransferase/cysteine synthase [Candidatus Ornithomonoglobus intestinigallinarum]|uniref:O-acetylhomoserine aminocarboxypropyltransferase/cysteine synthase n=1 Tax=Candidatus Ornithomonoglobus intestinigallinarum TaxID=2840894 RepID=A0A9D1H4X7_9FIRM|nr:O-acetylhomoserine aminocarboxypropyltransferase/cysteine synthase [Candidatus Ornithomonoglobus intestinigallinarum]
MKIETKCIQSGYKPKSGEARVLPIYQSTTYKYDSAEHMGKLFDLEEDGYFYTRLANPTCGAVEEKIADLEGGVGAMLTSSGQAATLAAVMTIARAGDHIVCSNSVYGGTFNLLDVTLKKFGIDVTFVDPDAEAAEIGKAFKDNTKALLGETIANPALTVLDIEKFAKLAHSHGVPLIVDNTFATPVLCRPIEFGADIVIHSTSKYLDGHAVALGGVVVDSGNFDWAASGKFPEFTVPDESYHGVVYTEKFGRAAFIVKARAQLMRDMGFAPAPMNAFLLNLGTETLHLRMPRHSENALKVAEFLENDDRIAWVNYPGLASSKYKPLVDKYLPNGASGVVSFGIKGGREAAGRMLDAMELAAIVTHVADARTCALHPASTTHRQMTDEQLEECGVGADLIRLSVGIENAEDIIEDIKQALDKAVK